MRRRGPSVLFAVTLLLAGSAPAPAQGSATMPVPNPPSPPAAPAPPEVVSVSSAEIAGNGASRHAAISDDGRYVVFASEASNLDPRDANTIEDIFLRDRETGTTTLVSAVDLGGRNYQPAISGDGRFIAYTSESLDMSTGVTTIFVHDRVVGTTLSVGTGFFADEPSLSTDGRYGSFHAFRTADSSEADVFVWDRVTGQTVLGSRGDGQAIGAAMSGDGQTIAYQSDATNLLPTGNPVAVDIYATDWPSESTVRVSVTPTGAQGGGPNSRPEISADGRYVAWESYGANLAGPDGDSRPDVFVRDLVAGMTELVSVNIVSGEDAFYAEAAISADGSVVAYNRSVAGGSGLYVRDRSEPAPVAIPLGEASAPSDGQGFNADLSADGSLVAFGASDGLVDQVYVARTPDLQPHPVIFVHGLGASARDVGFEPLLLPLLTEFPGSVEIFSHYQDKQHRNEAGECENVGDPVLPEEPNGGMPVSLDSIGTDHCDSEGDLALNAVKLGAFVDEVYEEAGNRSVVIVSNSMGAAIVRGFIAYSAERGDGVAASMVDSVIYLQGAQDGVNWLRLFNNDFLSWLQEGLVEEGRDQFPANLNRPAADDLTPQSDWYGWTNPDADHVGAHPSYNVFGDIRLGIKTCLPFDPHGCSIAHLADLGDIALLPGTDDPLDLPLEGGARFLPAAPNADTWQWDLLRSVPWDPAADPFLRAFVSEATLAPEAHHRFGDEMGQITIADCQTQADSALDQALLRVIEGRMRDAPYDCIP